MQHQHPTFHGFIGGRHGGFHEADGVVRAHIYNANGTRTNSQHLGIWQRQSEAEHQVNGASNRRIDIAAYGTGVRQMIEFAELLNLWLMPDTVFEILSQLL